MNKFIFRFGLDKKEQKNVLFSPMISAFVLRTQKINKHTTYVRQVKAIEKNLDEIYSNERRYDWSLRQHKKLYF